MDNKKNLQEQLEKFKLYSNYESSKTLTENVAQIFEQYSSPEEEIFYTLARAASGPGTNEDLLIQAFSKFENFAQLLKVEKMMNDRPIAGKSTIAGLLRSELENDNQLDFQELQKVALSKGINISAGKVNAPGGGSVFDMNTITIKGGSNSTPTPTTTPPKKDNEVVNPRKNEEFPLKMGDKGEKIKKLQFCLGLPSNHQTGYFGEITMKAIHDNILSHVDKTRPPHGAHIVQINEIRMKGMDEETYMSFIKNCKGSKVTPTPDVNQNLTANLTSKDIPTTATVNPADKFGRPTQDQINLANSQTAPDVPTEPAVETQTLEQQFQTAKANLQKAKAELDAAQATRDRAKIGAARGKQQAARAEVQRLRNELYPPQQ